MEEVLRFIRVFQSEDNIKLFTECACYYFAELLQRRFPSSILMYEPNKVHFATKIDNRIYDITGVVNEEYSDYVEWEEYSSSADDADFILETCMKL